MTKESGGNAYSIGFAARRSNVVVQVNLIAGSTTAFTSERLDKLYASIAGYVEQLFTGLRSAALRPS